MSVAERVDVLVVGSGLAGLSAAVGCQQAGLSVRVCEAAPRVGGRVHSVYSSATAEGTVARNAQIITGRGGRHPPYVADLGPTWVWPTYQPAVQQVLAELALPLLPQFNDGYAIVERAEDQAPEKHALPGQYGLTRLRGGPQAIVNALIDQLKPGTVQVNQRVKRINYREENIEVVIALGEVDTGRPEATAIATASHVVMAVPLRIAEESVQFEPGLPAELTRLMVSTPTWMAAQAKVVVLYEHAFWRDAGLSGRIASQQGPLVEVHDHSGADGLPAALFGFIGQPFAVREQHRDALPAAVIAQLLRCFGDSAPQPDAVIIEDWALNPFVCSPRDLDSSGQHPGSMTDLIRTGLWQSRLFFAVAETSATSPGLIDGALDAGTTVASVIVAAAAAGVG